MTTNPLVFISYAQFDDDFEDSALRRFRDELLRTLRFVGGDEVAIFQEDTDVKIGQQVQECISQSLNEAMVLVPMLTPNLFKDPTCRDILTRFLERERQLGRNDLVLAVYYQHVPELDNAQAHRVNDPLLQTIAQRRTLDWRAFRGVAFNDPQVRKRLEGLAQRIIAVLKELQSKTGIQTDSPSTLVEVHALLRRPAPGSILSPKVFDIVWHSVYHPSPDPLAIDASLLLCTHLLPDAPPPVGERNSLPPQSYVHFSPLPAHPGHSAELRELAHLVREIALSQCTLLPGTRTGQQLVLLAARDQQSSEYYAAVVREFIYRYGVYFAGGVCWFEQKAKGDSIITQVIQYGSSAVMQLRTDFNTLDQAQQLSIIQRAWQEPVPRLLVFSNINSYDAVQQLGEVMPRYGGSHVLIISCWHELTRLATLEGKRCMRHLSGEQITTFYNTITTPLSRTSAEYVYDPCIYLRLGSFHRAAWLGRDDYLADVFCETGIYRILSSSVKHPMSHVVFGAKGTGKTALCKMLENQHRRLRNVLTVRLHPKKIQQQMGREQSITIDSWLEELLPQLLKSLVGRMERESKRLQKLRANEVEQLYGLCEVIGVDPPLLPEPTNIDRLRERISRRDAFERLEMIQGILVQTDFQHAQLLIDDINNQLFETSIDQAVTIITPLLQWLGSLHDSRLAIMLFLPDTLRHVADTVLIHTMNNHEIKWSDNELREMVRRRLAKLSTPDEPAADTTHADLLPDYPERFALLCESNVSARGEIVDDMLIRYAEGSPGKLMHLINTILSKHCTTQHAEYPSLISRATIESVLSEGSYD